MPKYAIYENKEKDIVYGKIHENMEIRIIQEFERYAPCSAQFHAARRVFKEIEDLYRQAVSNNADAHTLDTIGIALSGLGFPEAPYMDVAFDRLAIAQMAYIAFEREARKRHIRLIGAPREPLPGSLLAMSTDDLEDFRKTAEAHGFKSRF